MLMMMMLMMLNDGDDDLSCDFKGNILWENPKCVRVENEQTVDCELSISFIICYVLAVRLKMNG